MIKRYSPTIQNYYEKFFDSFFLLDKKKSIQYVNLSIPTQVKSGEEIKTNDTLDWYVNITHQEASVNRSFQDWFVRQFLYSYCDTIVMNLQNVQNAQQIPFHSYADLKLEQLEVEYRKANPLVYELSKKIEGKSKEIFIMSKELDIQNIANIEFLKTQYTTKYLCIKQSLVNDTFEAIDDKTEIFMKENNIKLLPLKHLSSFGITERLMESKKYKSILFEDDAINSKFADTKYPKQYLPEILLLAVSTDEEERLKDKPKFANFSNMIKEHYAIESDIHLDDEGMKYFTLEKRRKGIREDYEAMFKMNESEYDEFELNKRVQPGINMLKKERQKSRRSE